MGSREWGLGKGEWRVGTGRVRKEEWGVLRYIIIINLTMMFKIE